MATPHPSNPRAWLKHCCNGYNLWPTAVVSPSRVGTRIDDSVAAGLDHGPMKNRPSPDGLKASHLKLEPRFSVSAADYGLGMFQPPGSHAALMPMLCQLFPGIPLKKIMFHNSYPICCHLLYSKSLTTIGKQKKHTNLQHLNT